MMSYHVGVVVKPNSDHYSSFCFDCHNKGNQVLVMDGLGVGPRIQEELHNFFLIVCSCHM